MRSIALRYESSSTLSEAMSQAADGFPGSDTSPMVRPARSLPVPAEEEEVLEGEWVLARVETDADRRFAAAAAVGRRVGNDVALCFGKLDWERILTLTMPSSSRPPSPSRPPTLDPMDDVPPNSLRTPGLRIALVDHDPSTRAELEGTLRGQGLEVVAFENEMSALAERGPLHAAVVSYGLPGGGAKALARKMRESRPSGLPVLFVSSQRCSREIVEAYAGGCDDYLARPFRGAELGARVLGLLRRSIDAYR